MIPVPRQVYDYARDEVRAGKLPTTIDIAAALRIPRDVVCAAMVKLRERGAITTDIVGTGGGRQRVLRVTAINRPLRGLPRGTAELDAHGMTSTDRRRNAAAMMPGVQALWRRGPLLIREVHAAILATGCPPGRLAHAIWTMNRSGLLVSPIPTGGPRTDYRVRAVVPAWRTDWRGPTRRTPGARTRGLIPDGVITGTAPPPPPEPIYEPVVPAETLTRTPSHTAPGMAEDCVKQRLMAPVRSFDPGDLDATWLAELLHGSDFDTIVAARKKVKP